MKKVALIGGSFNPITNAHITMGLEIAGLTDCDEIWFYIAYKHPWQKKLMPAEHRLKMVQLATDKYFKLKSCAFEIDEGDSVYDTGHETAQILKNKLLPKYPDYKFCWVMGSDVAQTFDKWTGSDWMKDNLDIYIIHRLGYEFDKQNSILSDERHIYLKDNIVTSNISSSLVRERGRNYEANKLMALVPDVVWNYLSQYRLLDPEVLQ